MFGSPYSAALLLVLHHLRDRIRVLVGHSKGNYVIENALEGLVTLSAGKHQRLPVDLQIVTLGAIVRFPEPFRHVNQFIGMLDGFGWMNSRWLIDYSPVHAAWHSLNSMLPGHMNIADALRHAGVH